VVLDVSYSMDCSDGEGCSRLHASEQSMATLISQVLENKDRAELITFATRPHKHFGLLQKHRIDLQRAMQQVRTADRGGTALYDAIKYAIDTCPRDARFHGLQRELVVLTDGQDNGSDTSFSDIRKLVAKPGLSHFHLVLIGVGLCDQSRANMEALCQPRHCTFLNITAKPSQIRAAFQRAQGEIVRRREVHVRAWAEGASVGKVNLMGLATATMDALSGGSMQRALLGGTGGKGSTGGKGGKGSAGGKGGKRR
jgi:Mg-chelatase subunit ChlD